MGSDFFGLVDRFGVSSSLKKCLTCFLCLFYPVIIGYYGQLSISPSNPILLLKKKTVFALRPDMWLMRLLPAMRRAGPPGRQKERGTAESHFSPLLGLALIQSRESPAARQSDRA